MSNESSETPTNNRTQSRSYRGLDDEDGTGRAIETLATETASAVESTDRFSVDSLFEILAHPGRRYILTYLLQTEGFVTCTELVDHVVERTDHSMTDVEFRRRVTAELTNTHLPKLDAEGLIDYNMERQIAAPTEVTPVVRPYIRLALAHQQYAEPEETD